MSLYADDKILYTKIPKVSTQKLLGLINEFNKVAGHKINIKKSVALQKYQNEIWWSIRNELWNIRNGMKNKCDPYQITHDIFHRTKTNNPKIYIEP